MPLEKQSQVVVFSVPRTIEVVFHPEERAMVGHWHNLASEEMRSALERALQECERMQALCWIVDLTRNPGVPTQADLEWIVGPGAALARRAGVVAVLNVHGDSALARMGSRRWKGVSSEALSVIDCSSLDEALDLARHIALEAGHGEP